MTKAELFRYLAERAGAKRTPPASRRVARDGAATTKPHNVSFRAAKNASFALEVSAGRPSRKSTRKSANRQKNDVQFRMRRRAAEGRPVREA